MRDVVKERLRKIAPLVGLPIFYVVCLVVFISWTFPYDKLKERIVVSFNAQQRETGGNQELRIDDLTSSWVTGIKATGVHLLSAATEPGKPPTDLKIDEARARIALFPLLIGNKDVSYRLEAFGGIVKGEYDDKGKEKVVEVALDAVDMAQIEPLTALLGVPIEGKLTGEVSLTMPEGKASKGNGTVNLTAADVAIGDGKAKLKGQLALPRMNVGALTLTADAKEGILRVSKLGAGGRDLELQGDGRVQMREMATESLCDMNVRFKINDAYRNKDDKTKALFGTPGSNAPALFELADPKVKQAKRPDGFYGFHMRGPLGRPEFDAAPYAGTGSPATPGGAGGPGGAALTPKASTLPQ